MAAGFEKNVLIGSYDPIRSDLPIAMQDTQFIGIASICRHAVSVDNFFTFIFELIERMHKWVIKSNRKHTANTQRGSDVGTGVTAVFGQTRKADNDGNVSDCEWQPLPCGQDLPCDADSDVSNCDEQQTLLCGQKLPCGAGSDVSDCDEQQTLLCGQKLPSDKIESVSEDIQSRRPIGAEMPKSTLQHGVKRPHSNDKNITTKKAKYYCTYTPSLASKFPGTSQSTRKVTDVKLTAKGLSNNNYFFCNICQVDLSLAYSGIRDITEHSVKPMHLNNLKFKQSSTMIDEIYKPVGISVNEKVERSKKTFVTLLAQNIVPMAFADAFNHSVTDMFPDSEMAKKF